MKIVVYFDFWIQSKINVVTKQLFTLQRRMASPSESKPK